MAITFIGAGTAVTAVNASLSPAPHASTAVGDLKLVLASIRATTATVDDIEGWEKIADGGNVAILARFHATGDPTPTITFSDGAAGDDTISQMATFRGVEASLGAIVAVIQSNASAQNIAYPAYDVIADNQALIIAGWKQDDWTSAATPAGFTAIGTTSTITGNDAAQGWWRQIQTTATDLTASSVTVTGGLAAVSTAIVLALRHPAAASVATQNVYPPRVQVSVTGLTPGDDVAVYRTVGTVETLLRGTPVADVTDTSFLVVDAELPFGVSVGYRVEVNSQASYTVAGSVYTLTGGKVALSDAITGQAAEVVVMSWPEKAYSRAGTRFVVGGRNIVVTGALGQFESSLVIRTETTQQRDLLMALLAQATEGTLQIRQPGGYDGIDAYLAIMSVSEQRVTRHGDNPHRHYTLGVFEVDGWAPSLMTRGFTLQDIADSYVGLTLTDLNGDYATLLAVAQADWSA